ncbi:hypothetical protein [Leptolyngbya sp. NIES-2104]|uniref:hypothetical protein n=1 Tax=Leptolyngbya sp. NIES-2104 TaxID=1552121 RepID=UPI0006EC6C37|nr:hypothetical protein [Leptolyngbya sp. NIES-2104]GAP93556.1 hypothetical protein NIES2104_00620 [Leptolyngbya sp. NIES-2104]
MLTNGDGANNSGIYVAADVATTSAAAVTNNSFFSFTVTPTGGTLLNLNFLRFDAAFTGLPSIGGQASSYTSFSLRSSLDNYSSDTGGVLTTNTRSPTFSPMTFSLTAPAYQNLAAPITFRVYVFGVSYSRPTPPRFTDGAGARFDNVTLDATPITPVPFAFTPLPGLALAWVTGAARQRMRSTQSK